MGTKLHHRLIAALLLVSATTAQAQSQAAKPATPDKPAAIPQKPDTPPAATRRAPPVLPELVLPGPSGIISGQTSTAERSTATSQAAAAHHERQARELAKAAAPLGQFAVKLNLWRPPHGVFLTRLRDQILEADAAGNTTERDRLLRIYEPWAEKYLRAD